MSEKERKIKTAGKQYKREGVTFNNIWNDKDNDCYCLDPNSVQYVQPLEFGGNTLHIVAGKPIGEDGKVSDKYAVFLAYSDEYISQNYRGYAQTMKELEQLKNTKGGAKNEYGGLLTYAAILERDEGVVKAKNAALPIAEKSSHKKIYEEIEKRVKNGQATHLEKLYLRQIEESELDAAMRSWIGNERVAKAMYTEDEITGKKKQHSKDAKYDWYYKASPIKDEIIAKLPIKITAVKEAQNRIQYRNKLKEIRKRRDKDGWNAFQSGYIDGKVFILGQNEPQNTNGEENLLASNVSQSLKNQNTVAKKKLSSITYDLNTSQPEQNAPEQTPSQKQQKSFSPEDIMRLKQNQSDIT